MISKLEKVLHEYDTEERIKVILPFASLFEPELEGDEDKTKPSVRHLRSLYAYTDDWLAAPRHLYASL